MARQKHRGQHASDSKLFSEKWVPVLNQAVEDLSYLLNKGYSDASALQLVGNRYLLQKRQRMALLRASTGKNAAASRMASMLAPEKLKGKKVAIDGYNLLITVESILAGGIILHCRDGSLRDIASVHGTYRKVEETMPALSLIGKNLVELGVTHAQWYLDAPISNSGRLKGLMYEFAEENNFPWDIELVNNPDKPLAKEEEKAVISSDGWVLDRCKSWFNLPMHLCKKIPEVSLVLLHSLD